MLRRGIDPLVPQCFLRFATIARGELRAHEALDVRYVALLPCSDYHRSTSTAALSCERAIWLVILGVVIA